MFLVCCCGIVGLWIAFVDGSVMLPAAEEEEEEVSIDFLYPACKARA